MQQSGAKSTLTGRGITAFVQIRFEAVSQGRFNTRLLDGPNWWGTKRQVKKQHGVHFYLLGHRPNPIFTNYIIDCTINTVICENQVPGNRVVLGVTYNV